MHSRRQIWFVPIRLKCCKFWPAIVCCTLQMLVEICFFNVFLCINEEKTRKLVQNLAKFSKKIITGRASSTTNLLYNILGLVLMLITQAHNYCTMLIIKYEDEKQKIRICFGCTTSYHELKNSSCWVGVRLNTRSMSCTACDRCM